KQFFDSHGGVRIFGYPRTPEIKENGWTVQYFQRARFEYHPEFAGTRYEVELGLLGDMVAGQTFAKAPPAARARFYKETSHNLSGAFLKFFDSQGGLDVFGYPTSEPYKANGLMVQYFQRSRFELHGSQVELGLVGDEYLAQRAAAAATSTVPTVAATSLAPPAPLPVITASPALPGPPPIRVAIFGAPNPSNTIHIGANGPFNVTDTSGRQLFGGSTGQSFTVAATTPSSYVVSFNGQNITSALPVEAVPVGSTILQELDLPALFQSYRGAIEAVYSTKSNNLWEVNQLSLEDYVKGIGEEPEGLPAEAYKVLSVAYRTYALAVQQRHQHDPAWGEPFDLGSSTQWVEPYTGANQIYAGEHRETLGPLLTRGEQATFGQVVTYNGAVAITPYYSHSDGHTRSWAEVWHGNDHPWLVSVPDPDSNGLQLLGHGVGMPLRSVGIRAAAGWTYDQILRYFYTGVRITKLY
ncbi:MAG: SpoIID/LytB domain-containing protein, partial [Chloroflexota bacterium]